MCLWAATETRAKSQGVAISESSQPVRGRWRSAFTPHHQLTIGTVERSPPLLRCEARWAAVKSTEPRIQKYRRVARLVGNGQHQPPLPAEHRAVDAAGRFREELAGQHLELLGEVGEVDF